MTHLNRLLYAGLILVLLLGAAAVPEGTVRAAGGISLTAIGAMYTQDFNMLASTGTTNNLDTLNNGWYLSESGGGARDNEQYAAGNGSDNTGDTYSYGADGSTERALGSVRTGTLISMYGASFTNDTGSAISSLVIAYTGEEWRLGAATGRTDQLMFEYSIDAASLTTGTWTGVPALDFNTPDTTITGAKDGNAAGERTTLSATIAGLNIPDGSTFWIRWSDVEATGSDDGLAIDDFALTPLGATFVTNVTSTSTDSTYTTGALIPVTITFSEPVNVTGAPRLTLETGVTDRVVDYSGGGGTDTLTFNYIVQDGDISTDLDYVDTNSLALNGGTIRDAATNTNDAVMTLASPGADGSLGFNKAIVIDATAPTVTNVSATIGDGAYTTGEVIPITVTFSEPVNVTGTPQLTLATGAIHRAVNYMDGSGTDTLTFNYIVQDGDISTDLDYVDTNSLALNGGTIRDAINNDAILTLSPPGTSGSLGSNKEIVIFIPITFTSPNSVTLTAGSLSTFTITTTGYPIPSLGNSGILPSGISFVDNGDGTATMGGTPALNSVGTHNLIFTAHNGVSLDVTQNFTLTIDGSPGVSLINSDADTGDRQILEDERTTAAITRLLVVFNKDMNIGDATYYGNYRLVKDGSMLISIDSISYIPETFTAILDINNLIALPDGAYTLTVSRKMRDISGSSIGADFVRNFHIDRTAPILNSFTHQDPASSPTSADTLVFRATFSEDVQNVNAYDFAVSGTTATVTNVSLVTSSIYDITVSGGDLAGLNGTVGLDLSPAQDITDAAGNPLPDGKPALDEMYDVHNTGTGTATLVSPTGNIMTKAPTYIWEQVGGATWYYLWVNGSSGNVIKQWYDASLICNEGTCSVTPATALGAGTYKWWIRTWNNLGYGPWSDGMNFIVSAPGKASLVSPTGSISMNPPTYIWNAVDGATWYYLWVNGSSGNVIKQWYDASVICSEGTCSVTPTTALSAGAHTWWVQTYNTAGYGLWSDSMSFTPLLLGKATLVSPTGNIGTSTPTYTWDEVSGATWYYLWINDPSGNIFKQWYEGSVVCSSGSCSVVPAGLTLSASTHTWRIQTWNSVGYGPWSDEMSFSPTPPARTTLVSPTGSTSDTTPTYTWDEVSGATWYYLWVNGPSGNVIKQWYDASVICSEGTCSVTPTSALVAGSHTWWVQTWNSAGYGPWSDHMDFSVSPQSQ